MDKAVEVYIPGPLREYTGGAPSITVDPGSISEVLDRLESRHPGIRQRVLDDQGRIRRHVKIFLNAEPIPTDDLGALQARPGDKLQILPSVSGG